jgi:hypothetical protein
MSLSPRDILKYPEPELFVLGGCHIFALTLTAYFKYPLVIIHSDNSSHYHVACHPFLDEKRWIVDAYGWFTTDTYTKTGNHEGETLKFKPVPDNARDKSAFLQLENHKLIFDIDFFNEVGRRATCWIDSHFKNFDGIDATLRGPIMGYSRVQRSNDKHGAFR